MILSSHVAVGAAVGTITKSPSIGFLAGLLSHHISDLIPHTDIGSGGVSIHNIFENKRALTNLFFDGLLAAVIIMIALHSVGYSLVLLTSIIGATLPDIIDNSPFWSKKLRKVFPFNYYHRFHEIYHNTVMEKKYLWVGYATQGVLVIFSLYVVLK